MISKPWDILGDFSYSTSNLVLLALPSDFVTCLLASASPPAPLLRAPSPPAAQLWWPLLGPLCSLYSNLQPVARRALSGTYYWFLFTPTNPLWFPISCTKSRALHIPAQTTAPSPLLVCRPPWPHCCFSDILRPSSLKTPAKPVSLLSGMLNPQPPGFVKVSVPRSCDLRDLLWPCFPLPMPYLLS